MGGFFGRTGRGPVDDAELKRLEAALDTLTHRGPQARLTRVHQGTYLGFRQQLGDAEQPCQAGDWDVLFDGALQNHTALSRRLNLGGDVEAKRTDAQVVAAWMATYGPAGLADLEGQFAIAAVHRKGGNTVLARDRFGVVPLYTCELGGRLLFASEPRALKAASPTAFTLDNAAIASFFATGQTLGTSTYWQEVKQVVPGTYVRWHAETCQASSTAWYKWPTAVGSQVPLPDAQAERDAVLETLLQTLLSESVAASTAPGVLVNADLGSALLAYYAVQAARAAGRSPPVLCTMGLPGTPAEADAAYAVHVARHVGAPHTVLDWDINAPFDFELLARTFDLPCADVSSYLFCRVASQAREHGNVWLTGSGATSAFLGARHQLAALGAMASPWQGRLQGLAQQSKAFCGPFSQQRRALDRATLPTTLVAHSFSTMTHASAMRHVLLPEVLPHIEAAEHALQTHVEPWATQPLEVQLRLQDIHILQPMRQLLKIDRAAHAFGQQWQLPWHDGRIMAHADALPQGDLLSGGIGAQPLRRLIAKRLPQSVSTLQRSASPLSFKRLLHPAQERALMARVHETPALRAWVDADKFTDLLEAWRQTPTGHLDGTVWRLTAMAVWMERWSA